jgi:CheY-like chemotaxis protein
MDPGKNQALASGRLDSHAAKARVRLLIVDDEPAIREVTSSVLTEEGYEVLTAEDGFDALRLLSEPLPDVMITDLNMPRMSGVELLEVVRQRFPQLPVIVISGQFMANEPPTGLLADAFLPKGSYTHLDLCAKITELVAASANRK